MADKKEKLEKKKDEKEVTPAPTPATAPKDMLTLKKQARKPRQKCFS